MKSLLYKWSITMEQNNNNHNKYPKTSSTFLQTTTQQPACQKLSKKWIWKELYTRRQVQCLVLMHKIVNMNLIGAKKQQQKTMKLTTSRTRSLHRYTHFRANIPFSQERPVTGMKICRYNHKYSQRRFLRGSAREHWTLTSYPLRAQYRYRQADP